jgi:hypothetical protein
MIHVISTSACLLDEYELRKRQYLEGLAAVKDHYKIDPYIIESCGSDYLGDQFVGSNSFNPNKGVNEFANIKAFFEKHGHLFNDEDDIIKTTLRYKIISPYFIDLVRTGTQDIYCKSSVDIYGAGDFGVHTFLMSMKYRCWKDFFNTYFDINSPDPIEWAVSKYARDKNSTLIDRLDMIAMPWNHRPRTYTV